MARNYSNITPGYPNRGSGSGSDFGPRNLTNPPGASKIHPGIDIPAPTGTPVQAQADGKVLRSYYSKTGGNTVIIEYDLPGGGKAYTQDMHLDSRSVKNDDRVTAGKKIGEVGNTGNSSGPHLHHEERAGVPDKNGKYDFYKSVPMDPDKDPFGFGSGKPNAPTGDPASWLDQLEKDILDSLLDLSKNLSDFGKNIKDWWDRAKNWAWPRDPIILDLDGDGLETVGLAANIHFDHDGDGVLTKTGWAGTNDALLVWDRNANGSIDTGAELFGDFTPLPNGTLAPNGFAALAALDANGDGILDASDPAFAELKLWRDTDQNGQTGAGELISLLDAGIVSLNLAHTLKNQRLANGNTLAREGSFTRADGTVGGMGEFHLATDTFDTRFADTIEVPEPLKTLPNMGGAGSVRELQQAAAQSGSVAGVLAQFQSAPTRAEQKALLDQLITAWAGTSGMAKSLEERASGKYRIQYEAFGNERRSSNLDTGAFIAASSGSVGSGGGSAALMTDFGGMHLSERYRNLIAEWGRKLHVLEAFNGQYFFNLPEKKSQTDGANDSVWSIAA